MNFKIDKHHLFQTYLEKIILYESIHSENNNKSIKNLLKIEENEYINSIYFVGLFYLQYLNDNISNEQHEEMKMKFFEKYSEYFFKPVPNEIIENIKSLTN